MPDYITGVIETSDDDSDRKSSDEEKFNEEISDEEN